METAVSNPRRPAAQANLADILGTVIGIALSRLKLPRLLTFSFLSTGESPAAARTTGAAPLWRTATGTRRLQSHLPTISPAYNLTCLDSHRPASRLSHPIPSRKTGSAAAPCSAPVAKGQYQPLNLITASDSPPFPAAAA
jgi:hypothetical protein